MTTASPQAYHRTPKTREQRHPEVMEFMHAYFDKYGKVPTAKIIIANTSIKHGAELTVIREKLAARGELVGSGRRCKMVRPE